MKFSREVGNYNGPGAEKMRNIQVRAERVIDADSVNFLPLIKRGKKLSSVAQPENNAKKSKANIGIKRKTIEHHPVNESRSTSNRNKSYKIPDRGMAHRNTYNGDMIFTSSPRRNHHDHDSRRNYGNTVPDNDDDDDDEDDCSGDDKNEYEECTNGADSEYTPVPVKQLIKEFEKTCRPVMQYKQIDPSKIATQLCALDNEMISRYFECRTCVPSAKQDEDTERVNNWNVHERIPVVGEQSVSCNYNDEPVPNTYFSAYHGVERANNVSEDPRQRDWRLKYIDEEETSTSDDSTETSDSPGRSLSTFEGNDGYCQRSESLTSELHANGGYRAQANGKVKHTSVGHLDQVTVDANDKSLILAMVASEGDILQTIKQLRRTPVLNNLVPSNGSGSPDLCRFNDIYPEVGKLMHTLHRTLLYTPVKIHIYL